MKSSKKEVSPQQHTPGPWIVGELSLSVLNMKGMEIAAYPENIDEDVWNANARLIAAAPELLEAAMRVQYAPKCEKENCEMPTCPWRLLRAAIQKAEGSR